MYKNHIIFIYEIHLFCNYFLWSGVSLVLRTTYQLPMTISIRLEFNAVGTEDIGRIAVSEKIHY